MKILDELLFCVGVIDTVCLVLAWCGVIQIDSP
jgi:hypothetical protein